MSEKKYENYPVDPEQIKEGDFIELDEKYQVQIGEAEKEVEEKYIKSKIMHIRMAPSEIERAKRLAAKKGLRYQTYLKMLLKQAMDKDEEAS